MGEMKCSKCGEHAVIGDGFKVCANCFGGIIDAVLDKPLKIFTCDNHAGFRTRGVSLIFAHNRTEARKLLNESLELMGFSTDGYHIIEYPDYTRLDPKVIILSAGQ